MTHAVPSLEDVRAGGKAALARVLALIESNPDDEGTARLLDQAWADPRAHVIGLTGPPGVGKSSLMGALIKAWRAENRTVGVVAVDPSSRATRGALLGDRTRLATDPADAGLFVRSMAARERLGGLAALTVPTMVLMRAIYDIVVIETVGVGQSETDVADVADTVIFCVQPGSGDSLQYMKAGIMEVPHIAVVTKADMGAVATRARSDVKGAMGLSERGKADWTPPVLLVSAATGEGIDELIEAADAHAAHLGPEGRAKSREAQGAQWFREMIAARYGREGLKAADRMADIPLGSPFARERAVSSRLKVESD